MQLVKPIVEIRGEEENEEMLRLAERSGLHKQVNIQRGKIRKLEIARQLISQKYQVIEKPLTGWVALDGKRVYLSLQAITTYGEEIPRKMLETIIAEKDNFQKLYVLHVDESPDPVLIGKKEDVYVVLGMWASEKGEP